MAGIRDHSKDLIAEWTICNISCWNLELHGAAITSPDFAWISGSVDLKLYPKGPGGQDEQIVVHLSGEVYRGIRGHLMFIGSDGSVLNSQQFSLSKNQYVLELPPGPKFEEVLAHIQGNEPLCDDLLTVRLKACVGYYCLENLRTTIDVIDTSDYKINPTAEMFHPSSKFPIRVYISKITFPLEEDNKMGSISLFYVKDSNCHGKIEMNSTDLSTSTLIETSLSVHKYDDVLRTVVNAHIVSHEEKWTILVPPLSDKEAKEDGVYLLIRVKIIGNKYKHQGSYTLHNAHIESELLPCSSRSSNKYKTSGTREASENLHAVPSTELERSPEKSSKHLVDSVAVLTKDLMCLYQDQDFSDLQLKCGNVTFPVHRAILSAWSPVFKTMLSTDMAEAASGTVDIGDLDPSTLGLFVTFLYTGSVEELQDDRALKLYYAADKYQVPSLKRECSDFLCSNATVSNVCNILSLAERHRDDQLKSAAHDFILRNFQTVVSSEEWEGLLEIDPVLVAKTMTHFAQKKLLGAVGT